MPDLTLLLTAPVALAPYPFDSWWSSHAASSATVRHVISIPSFHINTILYNLGCDTRQAAMVEQLVTEKECAPTPSPAQFCQAHIFAYAWACSHICVHTCMPVQSDHKMVNDDRCLSVCGFI